MLRFDHFRRWRFNAVFDSENGKASRGGAAGWTWPRLGRTEALNRATILAKAVTLIGSDVHKFSMSVSERHRSEETILSAVKSMQQSVILVRRPGLLLLAIGFIFFAHGCSAPPSPSDVTDADTTEMASSDGVQESTVVSEPLQPYWNTWFEDGEDVVPDARLAKDRVYKFVLDLAPYDFSPVEKYSVWSTSAEKSLVDEIRSAPGTVKMTLRPFVSGALVGPTEIKDIVVVVDPKRLSWSTDEEQKSYYKFRSGNLGLREFAKKVRAAWVMPDGSTATPRRDPVSVSLRTAPFAGCGIIGFSVWDESGKKPLDHLVVRVPVGDDQYCQTDQGTASFESGFRSLLSTALGKRNVGDRPIDAGLHFFEAAVTPTQTLSMAVLADGRDENSTNVYSWELDVPLSKFFGEDVPLLLDEAQTTAIKTNESEDIKKLAYSYLSKQLYKRIFDDVKTKKRDQAQAAWGVLQELAQNKGLLVTRFVDRNGDILYAPLRLLHAGGDEKALKGDLTIVQALPRERYVSGDRCVKEWSYMLPQKLEKYQEDVLKKANRKKPASGWLRDIFGFVDNDLIQYLRPPDGENREPKSKAEGLLTVAHQSHGAFWFDKKARRFRSEDIQRPYPPGSVAVLATCEAAGIDNENRTALTQFNARGVDLIIAAPFQVRVSYGARLAVKLDKLLRKTNADGDPKRDRRLVSLFKEAANQVAADDTRRAFGDMRYEFLVLGDHELRLCPPEAGENR